jgi:hypothetical protein
MYDLTNYYRARIEAMSKEIERLNVREMQLTTFVFELLDKDCPQAYKDVIKGEIYKMQENDN